MSKTQAATPHKQPPLAAHKHYLPYAYFLAAAVLAVVKGIQARREAAPAPDA